MKNEEKVQQLAQKYKTPCRGVGDCEFEAYQSALEAMQWKEQQMIDNAVEWLKNRTMGDLCLSIDNKPLVNEFIESFKQAMQEE